MVRDIAPDGVSIEEGMVPSGTVIWGAGVEVKNAKRWLKCEADRAGRIPVGADLSLPGHPTVFVIGDAAKVAWKNGPDGLLDVPGIARIYFLISVRSPLLVAANWMWSYLTYSKGARLITHLRPGHVRKG